MHYVVALLWVKAAQHMRRAWDAVEIKLAGREMASGRGKCKMFCPCGVARSNPPVEHAWGGKS